MKKQILIGLILCIVPTIKAQWNGSSPSPLWTNSNVGIGISNPISPWASTLQVYNIQNADLSVKTSYNEWHIASDGGGDLFITESYPYDRRLFIKKGGKIGLGTTNPSSPWSNTLQIYHIADADLSVKTSYNEWHIASDGGGDLFITEGYPYDRRLFIKKGGKIGIGTNNPTSPWSNTLQIYNTSDADLSVKTSHNEWHIASDGGGDLFITEGISYDRRLFIQKGGNIGVGTNCPKYKLDVLGTIRAQEVKVDILGGCDFVFKNDYKLMDLKKLEEFVKTNQHLPEIAPEKEMVENGVNMKELQLKLLQKIEELTIYTIEQNKKIEALQNEIVEMKSALK